MTSESKTKDLLYQLSDPWLSSNHPVWLASTLLLKRNVKSYLFPGHEEKNKLDSLFLQIAESFNESTILSSPVLVRPKDVDFTTKEYLLEHYVSPEEYYQLHENQGFFFDKEGQFLGVIHDKDHLQLRYMEMTQDLERAWGKLLKIEGELGKKMEFAYSSRFGFLTADPSQSGTALSVSLFMHIPAIVHSGEFSELIDRHEEEEVEVSGLQGNIRELIGDLLIVKNRCSTGLSEESLLTAMRLWATKCFVLEMNLRKKIKESHDSGMKNKITRALGVLTHSYQLELPEAYNALSLVKLGKDLGWIQSPSSLNLTSLLFSCRRAHLMRHLNTPIPSEELPKKRAEYLANVAKDLQLSM